MTPLKSYGQGVRGLGSGPKWVKVCRRGQYVHMCPHDNQSSTFKRVCRSNPVIKLYYINRVEAFYIFSYICFFHLAVD